MFFCVPAYHFAILFLLTYFLTVSFANEDELLITTKDGQVQGKLLQAVDGEVRAFLGIPFAKPPLGNLRFRAPEPVEPWEGMKDATEYSNSCYQFPDSTFPGRILYCICTGKLNNQLCPLGQSLIDQLNLLEFCDDAGSACVGYHVISPGSNGLFQKAVMQNGVPTTPWASLSLEETWNRARKLGSLLGCSDPAELEACLQQVDVNQLATMQFGVMGPGFGGYPFIPVVDGVFLPDTIEVCLKEVLLGLNRDEGTYFLIYGVPGFDLGESLITKKQFLYGIDLIFPGGSEIEDVLMSEYINPASLKNPAVYREALIRMVTDTTFNCPVQGFAESYAQISGKPFLYHFLHRSSVNPWPEWMGVMHGYEIEFVFGRPLIPSLGYTEEEVEMSKRFMKHWANFARTGNPGVDGDTWPMFSPENMEYVTLDTNLPKKKMKLRASQCVFWNSLIIYILALKRDPSSAHRLRRDFTNK
uniref:Carboxylesterase type B domain-containing protein n=1 Tax=Mola mola TaxID=94237 RepID=A0A3Q3W5B8_MOLML